MKLAGRALVPLLLALAPLAACGDDDNAGDDTPGNPDASIELPADAATPDAAPLPIDAAPPPDARIPVLDCANDPAPTDPVPAQIVISGNVSTIANQSQAPVADAVVELHQRSDDALVGTASMTTATGNFQFTVETGTEPFDAYVKITKDGLMPLYLFFDRPLRADSTGNKLLTVSPGLIDTANSLGNAGIQKGDGIIAARVEDCENVGVDMAKLNVVGGDADTKSFDLGIAMWTGGQVLLNIPVGKDEAMMPKLTPVTVQFKNGNDILQEAAIKVNADAWSYVVIRP